MAFSRIGYGQVEPNKLSAQKTGQIFASLPLDTTVTVLQNGEFMYYDYATGKVTATDSTAVVGTNPVPGVQEPFMVFNEIKIYEDWLSLKDFAMFKVGDNYVTNPAAVGRVTSANTDGTVYGDGSLTTGVTPSVTYPDPDSANPQQPTMITKVGHTEYGYRMDGIAPRLFKINIGDIWTTNMVETGDNITYAAGDILKPKLTSRNTLELSKTGTIDTLQVVVAKVYTMPDGQPGLKVMRVK